MYDVFISYSHADKQIVNALNTRLHSDGVITFLDTKDIKPGEPIPKALEEALDDSRHIRCVLSPDYVESAWARMERYAVMVGDAAGYLGKLVPLMVRHLDSMACHRFFALSNI